MEATTAVFLKPLLPAPSGKAVRRTTKDPEKKKIIPACRNKLAIVVFTDQENVVSKYIKIKNCPRRDDSFATPHCCPKPSDSFATSHWCQL